MSENGKAKLKNTCENTNNCSIFASLLLKTIKQIMIGNIAIKRVINLRNQFGILNL